MYILIIYRKKEILRDITKVWNEKDIRIKEHIYMSLLSEILLKIKISDLNRRLCIYANRKRVKIYNFSLDNIFVSFGISCLQRQFKYSLLKMLQLV